LKRNVVSEKEFRFTSQNRKIKERRTENLKLTNLRYTENETEKILNEGGRRNRRT